ncbi:MAG: aspartyl/glutamyl-tRNA amidotransferase subunit C [Gemmatimonadetes bacterium]|jgi:aspartyl-tRNA(Asn)/glutamyl-tRNA(Gln) amidotransferase subunit C|nr:aspartyl/glutamyl-tRNA amidotransferase subunit C [Gemmatimonadota bacterium]MBP7550907.1 aspartyl/glutamyl-tRNA amidotransferase subunit C [Gemmatimonadaceae bacterium]MBK6456610.1 aspartyl/glutamyl-tRNA amidotransferase subunit C [Gemmatimonadota bacterium]MBK6842134.1 aspartyl/glutamyl-tRNA amidotransferase subunit C [Gemmatimonadota bacterium]MBK7835839.1 aspartyl/glutamyl-tRNA amidotransferase subunit C [Gemmatimonadota bacterium]
MSVTNDDVRHIAALARLGLEPDRVALLATELNGILAHMDVLAGVDTSAIDLHARGEGEGMPLRPDEGPSVPLTRPREAFAPEMREGFFLVPRLATHEDAAEES